MTDAAPFTPLAPHLFVALPAFLHPVFERTMHEDMQALQAAASGRNRRAVLLLAHRIKGVLAVVDAAEGVGLCEVIEQLAERRRMAALAARVAALENYLFTAGETP